MIQRYQTDMSGLNQIRIIGHERLADADEVTMTVYADGTRVYVNYGSDDYAEGGITVPARDYLVVKGGE